MNNILKEYLNKLNLIENVEQYDQFVQNLNYNLYNNHFDPTTIHNQRNTKIYNK